MQCENIYSFTLRHRFTPRDLLDWRSDPLEQVQIMKAFSEEEFFFWHLGREELRKLNIALALGSYMAEYQTDYHEDFARLMSELNENEWQLALRFCPYNDVAAAIDNLALIEAALDEAYLGLNSALAGLEVTNMGRVSLPYASNREKAKATSSLMSFTALYASYVDGCRRVRKFANLHQSRSYDRAIQRLLRDNVGRHAFIMDLRNFQLHYRIVEPHVITSLGENLASKLVLPASALLYAGYKWKNQARSFLSSSEEVNLIETVTAILTDVKRVIRFHRKLINRRLHREQSAYNVYCYERHRHNHLQVAAVHVGAVFKVPRSLMDRLLDQEFIAKVLSSALSEDEMRQSLMGMANRYKNLPEKIKKALELEISDRITRARLYPSARSYLQGRPFE